MGLHFQSPIPNPSAFIMPESSDINAEHARTAAQIEADVGVEHVGDVYAKALLDAAEAVGQTAATIADFDAFLAEALDRFPKLEALLSSALISPDDKSGILDRTLAGRASPLLLNFLKVVARHGRLDCLRAIHRQVHVQYDRLRNRIPVTLTTAAPPSPEMLRQIVDSLRTKLGGEPLLEQHTDPNLIGGAVLRFGDVIYDGSIANQLQNLRQHIHQSTAHEIQGRRDRFRHPAGN
jgi:F-type H+-transporting ATPase subunit delta